MSRYFKTLYGMFVIFFLINSMGFAADNDPDQDKKNSLPSIGNQADSLHIPQLTGVLAYDMKLLSRLEFPPASDELLDMITNPIVCFTGTGVIVGGLTFVVLKASHWLTGTAFLTGLAAAVCTSVFLCAYSGI